MKANPRFIIGGSAKTPCFENTSRTSRCPTLQNKNQRQKKSQSRLKVAQWIRHTRMPISACFTQVCQLCTIAHPPSTFIDRRKEFEVRRICTYAGATHLKGFRVQACSSAMLRWVRQTLHKDPAASTKRRKGQSRALAAVEPSQQKK
jgi:hypothetical protein